MMSGLERLAETWGIPFGPDIAEALNHYTTLLLAWNARINLTGAASHEVLVSEHLPDAFALASRLGSGGRVIDVGSGGGLPAIPLAILRPSLRLVLVEPIAKKVAFLRTAVREGGLGERVSIEPRRAQALPPARQFDVAISRATLPPPAWAALGVTLVRPGGRVFALTSADIALATRGLVRREAFPYAGGRRWLIEFERESPQS